MFDNRIKLLNKLLSSISGYEYYLHKVDSFNPTIVPDKNVIIVVGGKGFCKWVHLVCPCGCREILSLTLMKSHNPHWILCTDSLSRPSLYPSIWKKDGCKSHFWIRNGNIEWSYEWSDEDILDD